MSHRMLMARCESHLPRFLIRRPSLMLRAVSLCSSNLARISDASKPTSVHENMDLPAIVTTHARIQRN
jgi:hypothetical protein